MKIDGRLKEQNFKNLYGLNNVYVHKDGKNNYSVGINGTSLHDTKLTKDKAETTVSCYIFAKQ